MFHFFVKQNQLQEDHIEITGGDVNHITRVLRLKAGETVLISDETGQDYLCVLEELSPERVLAEIVETPEKNMELPVSVTLFQGLPKQEKMELIIQKMTELGANAIVPVSMQHCVVKLDQKKAASKVARWQAIAESAAKQSKRSRIPEVALPVTLADAVKRISDYDLFLVPYENEEGMERTRKLLSSLKPGMQIGILIGPEGGFSEHEIRLVSEAGAQTLSLGKRILRTETAGFTLMSGIMLQMDES